nr:glucose-1-phosphate cytidylyltransferase [Pseudomonadota bacterium]
TSEGCIWEQQPLMQLAADNELMAWEHNGFWLPMDTLRDKNELEKLWSKNKAPWKQW